MRAMLLQSCPVFCYPIHCSPPGSSVQGILQARILEWVAMPSSRASSPRGIEPPSLSSPALAGWGFPCGSAGKESTCDAGNLGSILGLGRSPGEGKGYSLQYSGLENSMDYIVPGVTKSRTLLSDFNFTLYG